MSTITEKILASGEKFIAPRKYRQEGMIGSGGMKTVIRAEDSETGRAVAIAVAKDVSGRSRRKFLEEARITAMLEHPNIVPVHEIGTTGEGMPYFTMKLVSGRNLAAVLHKLQEGDKSFSGLYTLPRLLDIFLKVCDAMSFAHSKGVVHLDLKPENIQVGDFGEVLVIDWGLAKKLEKIKDNTTTAGLAAPPPQPEEIEKTLDGVVKGTPEYMAPEQALGQNSMRGPLSDIYSLGAILYAMLTFHAPVRGSSSDEVIRNAAMGKIIPPRRQADGSRPVPAALQFVAYKALERDPSRRYQSVEALRADVEAYLNGYPTQAEDAGFFTRIMLFIKRRRSQVFLAASLLFTCFIIVAFLVARLYYKQIELNIYEYSERARIEAVRQRARLESKLREESSREWHAVVSSDFRKEGGSTAKWKMLPGSGAKFSSGSAGLKVEATGTEAVLECSEPVSKNEFRMTAELRPDSFGENGTVTFYPFTEPGLENACFVIEGGVSPRASIRVPETGAILAEAPVEFIPGYSCRIDVRRIQTTGMHFQLQLYLNDALVLSALNRSFFNSCFGTGFSRIRVENADILFQSVKFMRLGLPLKLDLVELAERAQYSGNFPLAEELFSEAVRSALSPNRISAAKYGLAATRLLRDNKGKLSEWKEKIMRACPDSEVRLHIEGAGFALNLSGGEIRSPDVLAALPLSSLKLDRCRAPGLDFIRGMPLKRLILIGTGTKDISPLRHLELEVFICRGNPVEDLAPLAGENSLRFLEISDSAVTRIDALEGLPLIGLNLSGALISDLTPLENSQVEILDVSRNRITSLAPLRSLPVRQLDCSFNSILSLDPLKGKQFSRLSVSNNLIADSKTFEGISAEELDCSGNKLEKAPEPASPQSVAVLNLSGNALSDISACSRMTGLASLDLSDNRLTSLEPLSGLRRLRKLSFAGNRIPSLGPLSQIFSLLFIDCSFNRIETLVPLDTLSPDVLIANGNPIKNYGKSLRFPPRKLYFLDDPGLTDEKIGRFLREEVPPSAAHPPRCSLELLSACRNGDKMALRRQAFSIGGKNYTLLPVIATYSDAMKLASKLGARLPVAVSPALQAKLRDAVDVDVWLNSIPFRNPTILAEGSFEHRLTRENPSPKALAAVLIEWPI